MKQSDGGTLAIIALAGAALATDLVTGAGMAGGALYAAAVAMSLRLPQRKHTLVTACICSVLLVRPGHYWKHSFLTVPPHLTISLAKPLPNMSPPKRRVC